MIGIDISDRSIKVAEVLSGRVPEFKTVCWSPLSPNLIRKGVIQDVPAFIRELSSTFTKCSPFPISRDSVVVSIPERQSFVRVLDLPIMSDEETDEAVGWAIRKDLPFDLDVVYIDWQPIVGPPNAHVRQVLVGAVQKAIIDPLLAAIDGAGLHVEALELESQAMVRSLLPLGSSDVEGIIICDFGATATKVIYFDRGAMRFTSNVLIGSDALTNELVKTFGITAEVATEKKSIVGVIARDGEDGKIASALRDAMLRVLGQVQSVVQGGISQISGGTGIKRILLSGGGANLPGIEAVFQEVFPGVPVQMGNPLINLLGDSSRSIPISPQDATHFVTSLGLALREPLV